MTRSFGVVVWWGTRMLTSWRRWEGDDAKMGGGPLQRRGIFWIRVVGTNPFVDSGEGEVGKEKERDSKPGLNLMTRWVTLPYVGWDLSLADRL